MGEDFLTMYIAKHKGGLPLSVKRGDTKVIHPCVQCLVRAICNVRFNKCEILMNYILIWLVQKSIKKQNKGKTHE